MPGGARLSQRRGRYKASNTRFDSQRFSFCQDNFPEPDVGEVASLAFRKLFQHRLQICGMLPRQEKILYAKQFSIADASDLPHVITAYVQGCEGILTYDRHFDTIADRIAVFTPGAWLASHPEPDAGF